MSFSFNFYKKIFRLFTVQMLHIFICVISEESDEVSIEVGEIITNIQTVDADVSGWWWGRTSDGRTGLFPATYVELIK